MKFNKEKSLKVTNINSANLTIKDYVIKGPEEMIERQIAYIESQCKAFTIDKRKKEMVVLW